MSGWILFAGLAALCNGVKSCTDKKALEKNTSFEILAWFSLMAFIMVMFVCEDAFDTELKWILVALLKAFIMIAAGVANFYALNRIDVGLHSVLSLFGVISTIVLSTILLGEKVTLPILSGSALVLIGLFILNVDFEKLKHRRNNKEKIENEKVPYIPILFIIFACICYSITGIIDKKVLVHITTSQLQFWLFYFFALGNWVILILKRIRDKKKVFEVFTLSTLRNNYWILLSSLCFAIADKCYYIASGIPDSKVMIMSLISKFSVIVTLVLSKIMFNEKHVLKEFFCSLLIILGIVITTL